MHVRYQNSFKEAIKRVLATEITGNDLYKDLQNINIRHQKTLLTVKHDKNLFQIFIK